MNINHFRNRPVLPSQEAFLLLWDDPVDYVAIECTQSLDYFLSNIIVEAPDNPKLVINMAPMRVGRA